MPEHIGVIGIGRLGLCFALNLEQAGYRVTGHDVLPGYVAALNDRTFDSPEPGVNDLLRKSQHFKATTELSDLLESDIDLFFVVVATPSRPEGEYDHSQIDALAAELKTSSNLRRRDLVIMCTTMPGYCDRLAEDLSEYDFHVTYNPEFIAQGTILHDQVHPDQILIGEADPEAGNRIEALYRKLCQSHPTICRMSRLSAEITKIATNCFLTTKISFANSIGDLATQVGAEPDKILAAIGADGRIGSRYLRYGHGYGGPCFPRDNRAIGIYAESVGYPLHLARATDRVNRDHLDFLVEQHLAESDLDSTIHFDQVTYKPGTRILEESQQLALAVRIAEAGRKVHITEHPLVIADLKERFGDLFLYSERA